MEGSSSCIKPDNEARCADCRILAMMKLYSYFGHAPRKLVPNSLKLAPYYRREHKDKQDPLD